jgi:hypothetical protein
MTDGSVGVVTHYELGSLGIEPWWGRDFVYPSRLLLRATQPPVQWILGLFPTGEAAGTWH